MIPGPRRRPVYGMAYGVMSGVQSTPRIMRGAPVVTPALFDVPLTNRRRDVAILHEQGRLTTVNGKQIKTGEKIVQMPDVLPLAGLESQGFARTLSGLESQGLARTLGSLGGNTLGSDADDRAEMARAKECLRPGEIRLRPGVCGPDPRDRSNPFAAEPGTYSIPFSTTTTRASAPMSGFGSSMTTPQKLVLGGLALAAVLYLRRK